MALSSVLKEVEQEIASAQAEAEKARQAAVDAVEPVTDGLVDSVNSDVATVFLNQRAVEESARKVQTEAARFVLGTRSWLSMLDELDSALKDLGDLEIWSSVANVHMNRVSTALSTAADRSAPKPPRKSNTSFASSRSSPSSSPVPNKPHFDSTLSPVSATSSTPASPPGAVDVSGTSAPLSPGGEQP